MYACMYVRVHACVRVAAWEGISTADALGICMRVTCTCHAWVWVCVCVCGGVYLWAHEGAWEGIGTADALGIAREHARGAREEERREDLEMYV